MRSRGQLDAHDRGEAQDPALAKWWAGAADLRSGGFDRLLVPHPQTETITALCAQRVGAMTYAHELIRLDRGRPEAFLDAAIDAAPAAHDRFGWRLLGAWRTAMVADDECILLWAIPSWEAWSLAEQALLSAPELLVGSAEKHVRSRHRVLLVDAPLSPLRVRPVAVAPVEQDLGDDGVHHGLAAAELQRQCLDDASSAWPCADSAKEATIRENTLGVFSRI